MMTKTSLHLVAMAALLGTASSVSAAALVFGDIDLVGVDGGYTVDPRVGASVSGLIPGQVSFGTFTYPHSWPFSPSVGDYAGTDRIFVGSNQTGFHDGYSGADERLPGPLVISLDYSSLIPSGSTATRLTLGILADDFQNVPFGQPYSAKINGVDAPILTAVLNGLDQTGPVARYFAIGLNPELINLTHTLTLSIDQGGDGGDGFAVDFVTIGVDLVPTAVPEPGTLAGVAGLGLAAFALGRRMIRKA